MIDCIQISLCIQVLIDAVEDRAGGNQSGENIHISPQALPKKQTRLVFSTEDLPIHRRVITVPAGL